MPGNSWFIHIIAFKLEIIGALYLKPKKIIKILKNEL